MRRRHSVIQWARFPTCPVTLKVTEPYVDPVFPFLRNSNPPPQRVDKTPPPHLPPAGMLGGCGVVVEVGGFLDQAFAVSGADGGVDPGLCKNEAIVRWAVGFSFGLVHF